MNLPLKGAALQYLPIDVSAVAQKSAASALPAGWQHGGVMEIFVRAYSDSDGDGIGDLKGLISKLDYLGALGVKGIWLMPIHPSEDRDHGYAVSDYRAIAPEFGTLADFDELVVQAHRRGIGVILDYVINHSARAHPMFQDAMANLQSPYRDWYVWQRSAPPDWRIFGRSPWHATTTGAYFAQFDVSMPDWNFRNPAVLKFHQDNLRFWLNRGVDGVRFDAVAHLIENGEGATYDQDDNLALVRALRETISAYDNRFMVVESTARGEVYGAANVGGSAFAFGLNGEIIKAARGDASALAKMARHPMLQPQMATFLGNHDEFAGRRLWNQFDGNLSLYKLAAAALLTLPGAPFIYYGEEIGMSGVRGLLGDPSLRAPMSWAPDAQTAGFTTGTPFRALADNASIQNARNQFGVVDSLHSFYSALLALRNDRLSLHSGRYENPQVDGQVLSFQRLLGDERTLVVINFSEAAAAIPRNGAPERAGLRQIFPRGSAVSPLIPAQSVRVFAID